VILVAGGQLDVNIGTLLRRILERRLDFRDLLVGPDLIPRVTFSLDSNAIVLNGQEIEPTSCFVRHDVFLHQKTQRETDFAAALNWFYAIRGWSLSRPGVKLFNRHSYLSENNKIENLRLAMQVGLVAPETIVTNEFKTAPADGECWIQKPIAGGEYTTLLSEFTAEGNGTRTSFPRFVQRRLHRPELRVYRIGETLLGFHLRSDDLDYRKNQRVEIEPLPVPEELIRPLFRLCDTLGLDFGAADFMKDDSGIYRFLELNSQPMFAAFDRASEGKLCDAIIDYLEQPAAPPF
jgi:hypothetical protein